jgi:signal transduction histidine kinase
MGAMLKLLRERLDPGRATSQEPSEQSLRELDLLLRTIERVDSLLSRSRPLVEPTQRRGLVDLRGVVDRAVSAGRALAATRGVLIDLEVAPNVPTVSGNADLWFSICRELLVNAVEATAQGSAVQVRVDRLRDVARLSIRDRGPGLGDRPAYKPGGMAMGLPIARAAAARLGARLRLRPAASGGMIAEVSVGTRP